jgi:hypothetical protein
MKAQSDGRGLKRLVSEILDVKLLSKHKTLIIFILCIFFDCI